ncbi:hypothetical protein GDO86_020216, partial [Hymenochirus boettgeri]
MSVLEMHHLDGGHRGSSDTDPSLGGTSGFLRGGPLWSSQRWNIFARGSQGSCDVPPVKNNFSSFRKSFSFRTRRSVETPTLAEKLEKRIRSRSVADTCSFHSSQRDLLKLESTVEGSKVNKNGLWQTLTSPFRKKQYNPGTLPRNEPALLGMMRAETQTRRDLGGKEWTLSRSVPELKVGIVGNLSSGKSALVHRYLTGTYVQEESPEGGRFKKEIVVDGQSYLLLIRDEGGPPEMQFAAWVDAVVFVFSLEDEISFQTVFNYYARLSSYRNTADVPMVLVGTQDAISATNPRVVDDSRARKLSNDLKRCTYYETCATYGLNVERVFQDVAQKVVAIRKKQQLSIGPCKSLPNSPSHSAVSTASIPSMHMNQTTNGGGTFSDYSSSVPSTPSISQRELRIETIAAASTPTPIRKQSKRRSNIFTV